MITITWEQLFWSLFIIFAITIGVVLIIALLKIIKLANKVDRIISNSEESIKVTLKNVSEITDNTNNLTFIARETMGSVAGSFGSLASSVKSSSKSILDSSSIFTDLILTAIKIIRKKLI